MHVNDREGQGATADDHCRWVASGRRKGRAQRLVAGDDSVECLFESTQLQSAGELEHDRHVVRATSAQRVEKPEPLLRERERRLAFRRAPRDDHAFWETLVHAAPSSMAFSINTARPRMVPVW